MSLWRAAFLISTALEKNMVFTRIPYDAYFLALVHMSIHTEKWEMISVERRLPLVSNVLRRSSYFHQRTRSYTFAAL